MSGFEHIYNKKIIATFDNYDQFYQHIRDHELYMDWIYADLTGSALYDVAIPDAIGGNDPLSVTWWCGEDRIEVSGVDIPQWSESIEGLPIRVEILIPEQFLNSCLATIQRISNSRGAPPSNIKVIDHPA